MNEIGLHGTALAPGAGRVREHPYKAVRASQVRLIVPLWARARPRRYAPLFLAVVGILALSGFTTWRVLAIATIYVCLMIFWIYQAIRGLGENIERSLVYTATLTTVAQGIVVGLTGGLASPLIPLLMGPAITLVVLFGRSRESTFLIWLMIVSTVLLALIPGALFGPHITWPFDVMLGGTSFLFNIVIVLQTILLVTDAHNLSGAALHRLREDFLSAATARTQSLDSIGAKVAHELKNPLSSIKGLVQLVSRSPVDQRGRERFEVIASEVTRMEEILHDYLSFSRPFADLRPQPLQLATVCDDVLAVLEARAQDAAVKLKRTGDAAVIGDARRLKEALLNLVANALEATPPRGAVEVGIQERSDGATVTVRDSGRGIGPEDLLRLGTPFFTTREGGTGLGVVLARSVIVQHGGEMSYASEVGRGTTVTVMLPRTPAVPSAGVIDGPGPAH